MRHRFIEHIANLGNVFKVSFAAMLITTAIGIYEFILPLFTDEYSHSLVIIGASVALIYVASFLCEIPIGIAVDRLGKKNVLISAMVALAILGLVYYFVEDLRLILLLSFVFGTMSVSFWISSGALVRDYSPKKMYGEAEGVYYSFMQIGWIIGPMIAGVIATYFALRNNFLLFSVMLAISIVYIYIMIRKKEKTEKISSVIGMEEFLHYKKSFKDYVLTHKYSLTLYVLMLLIYVWIGVEWTFVVIAGERVFHMNEMLIGFLLGAMMAIEGLLYFTAGYVMDKIGKKYIILSGFLLLFSTAYFAFLSTNKGMFIFFLLLAAGSIAWIIPGLEAMLTEIIPAHRRGEMTGVVDSSKDLGFIIGPVAGGLLGSFFSENPMVPFAMVAVLAGVGVFACVRLWRD